MLLAEPQRTQFDIEFPVTNIPVRISAWAWPTAAFFGWGAITQYESGLFKLLRLAIWIGVVLGSILLHELGHAWAFRRYGITSRIVLYYFGGLAIPDGVGAYREIDSKQQIIISAAGPVIQLALAVAMFGLLQLVRPGLFIVADGQFPFWSCLFNDLLWVNIAWPIFNLLPIYPLDGGKIARELFLMFNSLTGIRNSLVVSVATAGIVAVLLLQQGSTLMAIMFASFAIGSYQTFQQYMGNSYGDSGWR